jgi:hypothetical protein
MNTRPKATTSSCRIVILLCSFLAVATTNTGCMWAPLHPETYAYVYDVGNADQITKWALAKNDAGQIHDAISALSTLIAKDEQPLRAIQGIDQIHEKLVNGWSGLWEDGYRPHVATEALIHHCYHAIAGTSGPPAALKAEYLKMRPSDPARLRECGSGPHSITNGNCRACLRNIPMPHLRNYECPELLCGLCTSVG